MPSALYAFRKHPHTFAIGPVKYWSYLPPPGLTPVLCCVQEVSVLTALLQRADIAANTAAAGGLEADSSLFDMFWPGLQEALQGLPGIEPCGVGYACWLVSLWGKTVRGRGRLV